MSQCPLSSPYRADLDRHGLVGDERVLGVDGISTSLAPYLLASVDLLVSEILPSPPSVLWKLPFCLEYLHCEDVRSAGCRVHVVFVTREYQVLSIVFSHVQHAYTGFLLCSDCVV